MVSHLSHFFPLDFCVKWRDRHGDLCSVSASKLSAEAGDAAAGSGCLLLSQPPGIRLNHTP